LTSASGRKHAPEWQIWTALLIVYVVWGSTYLAIAVLVKTMPPLLSGGIRFLVAAAILLALVAWRRGAHRLRLNRNQLAGAAFVGLALLLGGNGLVMLGERTVPSGLAALIIAIVPLWVILLRLLFRERVHHATLLGVLVGFAGVAVLVVPGGSDGSSLIAGMLMLLVAAASWSVGSYFSTRVELPADQLVSTGVQMAVGGAGLLLVGFAAGEAAEFEPARFAPESVGALVYLIVFGSLIGYSAYTWLLQHTAVSRVATYAYVNPVVALLLGTIVLHETFDLGMAVGALMILLSVVVVLRTEARPRRVVASRLEPAA
jgi:drug/metabolite transporter (DMT)-like permease